MCGIAGFLGDFDPSLLDAMGARIAHRGPDDNGSLYLTEQRVGLCHRRLSIIDLSKMGHQPMLDPSGHVAIVFNGEIYNYRELRSELEVRGFRFKTETDTEVILMLYLADGTAMLGRLNGMFAFAIWDGNRNCLFLARDGFGVKPFYYCETSKGFLFASEIKALTLEASVSRELDFDAIDQYVRYLWCPHPRTMLRSVKKLAPGTAMLVQHGRIVKSWTYYDLPYGETKLNCSPDEAATSLRKLLRAAVQRQMVADVPVGAFLSGGLDSSAIVSFAREHVQVGKMPCFSIAFREQTWQSEGIAEDLEYAKRVARHLEVDLHIVTVGPEMIERVADMVYQLDEPLADPAALNQLFISSLARDSGIKVLLSGTGGDDIFSGYRRHVALTHDQYWRWMPSNILDMTKRLATSGQLGGALSRRMQRLLRGATESGDRRIAAYFEWLDEDALRKLRGPRMRSGMTAPAEDPLLCTLERLPRRTASLDKMLYLEAKHFLADHNLNYGDKMSMACGVEVRVPFLDPDLVAFATSLPVDFKQRGRCGKWLFKRAMVGILPDEVIYRPKTGFGVPVRSWLRKELRGMVEETLSEEVVKARGIFDAQAVRDLVEADREGWIDASYPVLALMCIELWCRRFIDS